MKRNPPPRMSLLSLLHQQRMSRLLFSVGLLLVLIDMSVVASPLNLMFENAPSDAKQKYCGKRLADIMSTICQGKYKRSDASEEVDLNDYRSDDQEWGGGGGGGGSIEPNQYRYDYVRISSPEEVRFVRKRRQIIEECCRNPCTIRTLKSYCG